MPRIGVERNYRGLRGFICFRFIPSTLCPIKISTLKCCGGLNFWFVQSEDANSNTNLLIGNCIMLGGGVIEQYIGNVKLR